MRRYESLRASDADRDEVTERLRDAAGEGRLEPDELETRVEAALRARTYGELGLLVADLPRDGDGSWLRSRSGSGARAALLVAGSVAAITIAVVMVALVILLVLAAVAVAATWWIACVLFLLACRRWRRHGARPPAWRRDAPSRHIRRARPSGLL